MRPNHTTTPVEEYWEWVSALIYACALSLFSLLPDNTHPTYHGRIYFTLCLCVRVSAASECCKSPAGSARWAACSGSCSAVCCSAGSSSTASSAAESTRAERWHNLKLFYSAASTLLGCFSLLDLSPKEKFNVITKDIKRFYWRKILQRNKCIFLWCWRERPTLI